MYQAGYTSITNVDYSSVCVESMAERHKDCAQLSWLCMDARRLAFPDGVFDVVLEKGTLDAMLVEETDPWKVSEKATQLLHQVLLEVRTFDFEGLQLPEFWRLLVSRYIKVKNVISSLLVAQNRNVLPSRWFCPKFRPLDKSRVLVLCKQKRASIILELHALSLT